jgi:PAS domain S-box-containing protein
MKVIDKRAPLRIENESANIDYPGLHSFLSTSGKWTYHDSEWRNMLGILPDNESDKTNFIHPADIAKYKSVITDAFENKNSFTIDVRFLRNDGTHVYIREIGKPDKSLSAEFTGLSCIGFNVSDLYKDKEANDRLSFIVEKVMEYSGDTIGLYDKDLRLLKMNRKAEEFTGLKSSEVEGKTFLELFPSAEKSKSHLDLVKALEGETIHNTRFDSKITNRTYENFLFPLKDANQNIYAVLAIAHDITEYVNATVEVQKAYRILEDKNRELERSNKELGSFTYVASHDLQEPLRKIQAFGRRIVEKEEQNLTDNGKDYLSRMVDAANRMQKLIDSLLEFSRTTTATKKFELSDLNILLEEVKRENKFSIDEKHAVIEVAPLPNIIVVPFQFKQLVWNLISNSLKYSKRDEKPHIEITCDILPSKEIDRPDIISGVNYCKISFKDNGIGFDPVFSEQIFELFQRLHGRAEYSGSGIGLAICKKIVENHEGYITAESKPGEGAAFHVYLPMKH